MKKYIATYSLLFLLSITLQGQIKLTILHTNDVHSQIEPITSGSLAGKGGVERRAAAIAQQRAQNPDLLLLDAGDYVQGTPYFNMFGGDAEIELMNALHYDVASLGNHEFDNGQEHLFTMLENATFPVVCANYDFSNSPLKDIIKPYTIIHKKGLRIAIIGLLVNLDGFVSYNSRQGIVYLDPIVKANELAAKLKKEDKCDLVICLSHLGYDDAGRPELPTDIMLAENSRNIDLIIGGHSHSFLEKPDVRTNLDGEKIPIYQVGKSGAYLGKITVTFEK